MKYLPIIIGIMIATGIYINGARLPVEIDPLPPIVTPIPTPTPTPTPAKHEVIAYIAKVFEPAGTHSVVRAINCFYSESGLRWDAIGVNTNGTHDSGVAQLNSIHIKRFGKEIQTDFRKNIDAAYQIYKERGWSAWYAWGCT